MDKEILKVAFVSDDGIHINGHFGPSKFYSVVTINKQGIIEVEQRAKANFHSNGHHNNSNHSASVHSHDCGNGEHSQDKHNSMISNIKDCQILVSGGMGYGIFSALQNSNIQPIITHHRTINEAVEHIIDGTIINHHEKLH